MTTHVKSSVTCVVILESITYYNLIEQILLDKFIPLLRSIHPIVLVILTIDNIKMRILSR